MFGKKNVLSTQGQDIIFRQARTHRYWQNRPVEEAHLREVYDLAKMGPTSANTCPMRVVFVQSKEAKERLRPALDEGNVDKTMSAPVTAIIAQDLTFYEELYRLNPHAKNARSWFEGNMPLIQETAFRNSTLQGAYFMIAARACGLDCGPMSGFNKELVDKIFFPETSYRSNFLCNLGYGDHQKLHPRQPRLSFEEVCTIV